MSVKHKIFGSTFNTFRSKDIKNNLVTFIVDDNESFMSNFVYIKEEFEKNGDFEYFFFNKNNLSIKNLKKLSKSKYIFLNDNFVAMAYMDFHPDTIITQLWHAPGAFKKFGASNNDDKNEIDLIKKSNEKVTYLINTSKNISKFYEEAFQIDKSKIKSFGIPRMDYYFKNHMNLREKFDEKYPIAKGKKIILYTPTFRNNEEDNNIFNFLDLDEFNKHLGQEYILALRLHPKIREFYKNDIHSKYDYVNVSDYESEQELLLISDLLISDYSSVVIEFATLNKPIILFTYDFDRYLNDDRGFYFDFKKDAPGSIVSSSEELIYTIENNLFENDNSKFLESQFDYIDGEASQRIVELLLN